MPKEPQKEQPQAKQVADRWHLLRNLGEAMERLTAQHCPLFRQVAQSSQAKVNASDSSDLLLATRAISGTPVAPEEISKVSRVEQRRLDRSARREAVYHQVKALREQGVSLAFIAEQTGISTRTVRRFIAAEQFPERARRRSQRCLTDAYKTHVQERIRSGYTNIAQLYREIKAKGYSGSYSCVYACVSRIAGQTTQGVQRVCSPGTGTREIPPSRAVAWWLQGHLTMSKPEIAEQQKAFLHAVFEHAPVLKEASDLAQEFIALVKGRLLDDFPLWLERASKSDCNEMRGFAQGIQQDLIAVTNAISLSWSNGQTEGQVNRLKMVKRQMYGRAAFDLLRARVMPLPIPSMTAA